MDLEANAELKEKKVKSEGVSTGDVKFVYKPPRLFRNSLIHKTLELIYPFNEPKNISHRSMRENLWWLFIMLVGFSIAFSIIEKAWQRFQLNPTFTSIILNDDDLQIPYPTVDICPHLAIDIAKVTSVLKHEPFVDKSAEITDVIKNFAHLNQKDMKSISNAMNTNDIRILTFKLAIECTDFIKNCTFKGKSVDCCTKFLPVLSEHGLCFSFNAMVYDSSLSELKNPEIATTIEHEDHTLKFELANSSKIFIHSRDEFLNHRHMEFASVDNQQSSLILISMRKTQTNDNARNLKVNQRKCFFENEMKSKFYVNERYTNAGCIRDARIERVQTSCGCLLPFYRPNNIENVTFCGVDDLACLQSENFMSRENAKCELPCDFDEFTNEKTFVRSDQEVMPSVTIDFIEWPRISFSREVRFGFIDFLVAFGSIFALFFGFSFLSLIELLMYFLGCVGDKFRGKKNTKNDNENKN